MYTSQAHHEIRGTFFSLTDLLPDFNLSSLFPYRNVSNFQLERTHRIHTDLRYRS